MPCPNCSKSASLAHKPFCSKRCQEVDLSRWFAGTYAVPAVETDEFSDLDAPEDTPQNDD